MSNKERLSALIGDIYDAALDPAQRLEVLDKIANFTGGQSGGLLLQHSLGISEKLYCYIGTDPQVLQAYSECYPDFDSTVAQRSILPNGSSALPISCHTTNFVAVAFIASGRGRTAGPTSPAR